MLADGQLERWEGALLTAGIVAYVWASFALASKGSPEVQEEFAGEIGDVSEARRVPGMVLAGLILAGLVLLVAGSSFFKAGGVSLAQRLGVSEAIIGLTVLAFGTSLPELATSIVACIKREGDIIAGNAVGSSVFNILAILGITTLAKPMPVSEIEVVDLAAMVGSAVVGVALMCTRSRLSRTEGTLMFLAYTAYVAMLVVRGSATAA